MLAPTRELARQVEKEFRESAPSDTLSVYGGVPVNQQMRSLNYGVDIVVGTPGRLIDLLRRGVLNLSKILFVVLDEADQMLAVGFDEDVEVIMEHLPQNRQSMLFSATMPSWIRKISSKYLKDPVVVDLVSDFISLSLLILASLMTNMHIGLLWFVTRMSLTKIWCCQNVGVTKSWAKE